MNKQTQTDLTPPFNWKAFAIVALLCLTAAAWSGLKLEELLTATGGAGLGEPLAKIEHRENNVRRKVGSSYVWNNAADQEKLYKKDSIRTAAGSAATIQFKDGSTLEVGENSLVVIDEIENLALNFKEGTVVVKAKDGTDTKISVDAHGKRKVEKLSIRMSQPEPFAERYASLGGTKQIQFAWEQRSGKAEPGNYRLEVATDRSFRSGLRTVKIPSFETTQGAQLDLPAGQYFWRLTQDGKALTPSAKFRVIAAAAAKPIQPAQGAQIITWSESSPVSFQWILPGDEDSPYKGVSHELEVATEPDFSAIVSHQHVSNQARSTLIKLPKGKYWWRIRSRYGSIEVASAQNSFSHEAGKKLALPLAFPVESAETPAGKDVSLAWGTLSDAKEYRWEVRDIEGNTVGSGKSGSQSATWKPKAPGVYQWRVLASNAEGNVTGESSWRPLNVVKEAAPQTSLFSQLSKSTTALPAVEAERLKTFTPEAPSKSALKTAAPAETVAKAPPPPSIPAPKAKFPADGAKFDLLENDFDTTLAWESVPKAKKYDVTLVKTPNGRKPASIAGAQVVKHEVVSDSKLRVKDLPPGRYAWSVRSIDADGQLSDSAEIRGFVVDEGAPLGAPDEVSAEVQ